MSTQPGVYNYVIEQGVAWNDQITYLQPDGVTPFNLTGYNASLRVRATPESSILYDFNTTNSKISIPTPSNGTMIMAPSATDMQGMTPGVYMYELAVFDAGSPPNVLPIIAGTFTVTSPVNKPWSLT